MKGAVAKAEEILPARPTATSCSSSITRPIPRFTSSTTGPEIWNDTDGKVDIFISGVGTGGTLTGVAATSSRGSPASRPSPSSPPTARCSPAASPARTRFRESAQALCPACWIQADRRSDPGQQRRGHRLGPPASGRKVCWSASRREPLFSRPCKVAKRPENAGKLIVAIIPSFGERYLSTILFEELRKEALALHHAHRRTRQGVSTASLSDK